jgi:hypothetical protein
MPERKLNPAIGQYPAVLDELTERASEVITLISSIDDAQRSSAETVRTPPIGGEGPGHRGRGGA